MVGYFRIWCCVLFRDESCTGDSVAMLCVTGRLPTSSDGLCNCSTADLLIITRCASGSL